VRIVCAAESDLDRYIDLLEELAEWMQTRGIEQWPRGRARNGRDYYKTSLENGELLTQPLVRCRRCSLLFVNPRGRGLDGTRRPFTSQPGSAPNIQRTRDWRQLVARAEGL
jgi:hypothetical protein